LLNIIYGFLIDNCQSYLVEFLGKDIEQNERKDMIEDMKFMRRLSINTLK